MAPGVISGAVGSVATIVLALFAIPRQRWKDLEDAVKKEVAVDADATNLAEGFLRSAIAELNLPEYRFQLLLGDVYAAKHEHAAAYQHYQSGWQSSPAGTELEEFALQRRDAMKILMNLDELDVPF